MKEMTGDSEKRRGVRGVDALAHIYMKPAHKIRAISDHNMLSSPGIRHISTT
jgi:hypothetical protein